MARLDAAGSQREAAKMAASLIAAAARTAPKNRGVDSLMYSVGAAARKAGYLADCDVVIGLPLSISGKSPYFDR